MNIIQSLTSFMQTAHSLVNYTNYINDQSNIPQYNLAINKAN